VRPLRYAIEAAPDAANLRFAATTAIDLEVLEATDAITLNAVDLDFRRVSLARDGGGAPLAPEETRADAEAQTVTFRFGGGPLAPGRWRLTLEYAGRISTQAAGLFALDYATAGGPRRALFTQFEAPDARRFFPSWDEPQFRTPYDLTVRVPAGQTAVSNMPAVRTEPQPDGTQRVTFQTTPAMSSYLLFLGVGEFDRITTRAAGVEVGVVTRKGAGEQGRWALEGSAKLLPWYNAYFGQPFPLPKLDNVAGPGSSQFFGAMENWGAIFSFESILLVDPAITSEARRQAIFEVAAHEMAHQWFGDLVTMAWWDDLWLNEGFASWMATKASAAIHPEWEPLLARVDGREAAMALDSVATTHPIVQRLQTVEQISQAFDAITYQKGEAVISMLEDSVGEGPWQRGVQAYMARHRMGNTVTDDLWRAVEEASGQPVTAVAHDFTLQPGVPLVRVERAACEGGRTVAELVQGEFTRDRPDAEPRRWRVPVLARAGAAPARALLEGGRGRAEVPGCGPLVVNSGQAGYYRTLYAPPLLEALAQGYASLPAVDQLGLLADQWALGLAGYQAPSLALGLLDRVPADGNPHVWLRAAGILTQLHTLYRGDAAGQALVARYASARLGPVLQRLGWEAREGEPANAAVLRAELLAALGKVGDPAVVREALRRAGAGHPSLAAGPLRQTLLGVVATNADARAWERLLAQARAERTPLVRQELYTLLGTARDARLARRALSLALTDEPGATTSGDIVSAVSEEHPDLAFDWALEHRAQVEGLVDASSRSRFVPGLIAGSADPAAVGKLRAYAERFMTPRSRGPADKAVAAVEDRLRVRTLRLPDVTAWLRARAR
jgi:aminopeptidase N